MESKINCIIGILKETISAFERRVPLTPQSCCELIKLGIKIIIQPSMTRCFSDEEYLNIGTELKEDLSECNIVLGVSEPQLDSLLADKTYMFFSHMKKGEKKNLRLLDRILAKRIRLIDYECIKENIENKAEAKRLVSFGKIAGIAGIINIIKGIGELLLSRNLATPFIFTKLSYMYTDIEEAKLNFKILGNYLREKYLPSKYTPFIIGILGNGQVSQGVQDALSYFPAVFLTPEQIINKKFEVRADTIYAVIFNLKDIYIKIDSKEEETFDKNHFINNPEQYRSAFFHKYFKYCNLIINCLYYEQRYPRVIRKSELQHVFSSHKTDLLGICDISCDLNGSIEILKEYSTYRSPFIIYEPVTEEYINDLDKASKEGIIYSAIPHLATSFPIDASEYFSNLVLPFIKNIALSKFPSSLDESGLIDELKNACITNNGALTYAYRNTFKYEEESKKLYLQSCDNFSNESRFFSTFKISGHLFDTGFFNSLIIFLNINNIKHKVNFLSIGESSAFPSILYFDSFGRDKEVIGKLFNFLELNSKQNELEYSLLKTNIN